MLISLLVYLLFFLLSVNLLFLNLSVSTHLVFSISLQIFYIFLNMKIFLSVYIINVLSIFFLYLSIYLTLHSLSVYRTLLYLPVHISVANSVTLFSRYPPGQPEMRGSSRPCTQSQHNLLILSSKYIYILER